MARIRTNKTNFTAGEISESMLGRSDLRAYANDAGLLRNVFVHPTGGISRRPGLRYLDTLPGKSRLVAFEFNTSQIYLLSFSDLEMHVYQDGVLLTSITTPWDEAKLDQINWVQSADTLLVMHPDIEPQKITRTSDASWTIVSWSFIAHETSGRIFQPHHKFADEAVTLTPGATNGSISLTASSDVFDANHIGTRFRLIDKEVEITAVTSATVAQATVKETLSSTTATRDWEEQALSAHRGWPVSACFHQDRLVIGGSRDLPNRLWMSRSADLFNFDLAEGLDDESIDFAILSDQVNAIRAVFSGRHLQVFTSGAEWMVTGDPLTPGNVQLKRQTRIGSPVKRTIPPRNVDGATLFIPRDGTGLREFLFADVEQAYQSSDLTILAKHLINTPVDQDYNSTSRLLHIVLGDGTLATVTIFRSEQVTAWTMQETQGAFRSIAISDGITYVIVERNGSWFLEKFDELCQADAALDGTSGTPIDTWSGLDHLEGMTVTVLADGAVHGDLLVSGGEIKLNSNASTMMAGLAYAHKISPLPPGNSGGAGGSQGSRLRPISFTFRLQDTLALRLNVGRGFTEIPFKKLGPKILDMPPQPFSGDRIVRAFGWHTTDVKPLWQIEHSAPLPFTLLSVVTELSVNG